MSAYPAGIGRAGVVGQLLAAEAVLAAALTAVAVAPDRLVLVAILGAVCLVVVLLRVAGRPPVGWLQVFLRYRRRRLRVPAEQDSLQSTMDLLLAGEPLSLDGFEDRRGTRFGLLLDRGSWTAVLAVQLDDQVLSGPARPEALPLGLLESVLSEHDVQLDSVRVIRHGVVGPADQPWSRVLTWVALTLHPARNRSAALARGGGRTGAQRALVATAARLTARAAAQGVRLRALPPEDVRALPAALLGSMSRPRAAADRGALRSESWAAWHMWGGAHLGLRVARWAPGEYVTAVLGRAVDARADAVTTSLTLRPGRRGAELSGLIRLTFLRDDEDAAVSAARAGERALRADARRLGGRLTTMHGEHELAVRATLPWVDR